MISSVLACWLIASVEITEEASSVVSGYDSKTSMRCYSEKSGPKYQICDKSFGFQTCFTKYDDIKQVVLRGCSSKRKMFHVECESHLSGTRNEQFCYCSYDLCNNARDYRAGEKSRMFVIIFTILVLSDNINYL
eukprot:GFUD01061005.1.p1 GENE.GFUD01061005.1~~GFUD01061005.1.p1  ORF type:complete len:134 (+),score=14.79 GFUD01061005.1:242-643(+)